MEKKYSNTGIEFCDIDLELMSISFFEEDEDNTSISIASENDNKLKRLSFIIENDDSIIEVLKDFDFHFKNEGTTSDQSDLKLKVKTLLDELKSIMEL